jgi:small GTP-binding protein
VVPLSGKEEIHYFVKLLMLGDSGVGKSCLMMRFSDGKFPLDVVGTAGIDCKERIVSAEDKNIRVQIWDTAGQERYSVLTESYYKKAYGILLVYDTTDAASFSSVDSWIKSIKDKVML